MDSDTAVQKAWEIALAAHGDQRYGAWSYGVHLQEVRCVLQELGCHSSELGQAAYLHDVLEDTGETAASLVVQGIPVYVVALVDAVTNIKNDVDAKAKTWCRIARLPEAVILKQADRIANMRAAISDSRWGLMEKYRKQYPLFRSILSARSGGSAKGWRILDILCIESSKE